MAEPPACRQLPFPEDSPVQLLSPGYFWCPHGRVGRPASYLFCNQETSPSLQCNWASWAREEPGQFSGSRLLPALPGDTDGPAAPGRPRSSRCSLGPRPTAQQGFSTPGTGGASRMSPRMSSPATVPHVCMALPRYSLQSAFTDIITSLLNAP